MKRKNKITLSAIFAFSVFVMGNIHAQSSNTPQVQEIKVKEQKEEKKSATQLESKTKTGDEKQSVVEKQVYKEEKEKEYLKSKSAYEKTGTLPK